ncbi:hypothetical protein LUZ60_006864 [Juncus effusus]|nr:hypothetical protein LUZ60_006864 [Juncus effusus]
MTGGDINQLPDECLSQVIACTSTRDACAAAAVCAGLKSAADSDATWQHFLPPDCEAVLSRAVEPVRYGSVKELFFRLCDDPVLIDGGKMSFGLERQSGAKCFMIAAKALWIVWSQDERYWNWVHLSDSRFPESAKLLEACWLEIQGKIPSDLLSPHTLYSTFLIFKLADNARGLGSPPQETSVTLGGEPVSKNSVCLQPDEGGKTARNPWGPFGFRFPRYMGMDVEMRENVKLPTKWRREKEKEEGWMEIEMGEVWNEKGEGGAVEISLMEITGGHWKRGLIIHGIEIRPKG